MLNRMKGLVVRFHEDRRGSQSVEILMILAVAAMVCLGVSQVAGVGLGGAESGGSGIMAGIGDWLGNFGLDGFF
jgi:Flp pilus assembly pilin Flp